MAKPKFPKKPNNAKDTTNSLPPLPEATVETAAASAPSPATETRKPENRKVARKPEIVRSEPRANLVPINLEDEIRSLAYLLSERRGFESGHETEDWLTAEREVRERYQQHSA